MSSGASWLEKLTLVRPEERPATLLSFLMVFILMAAYLVLRPVRDAMASDWSDAEVSLLWNLQLLLSIVLVALYSMAVSRWSLRRVVPGVYTLFALSFLGFWLATPLVSDATLLEKAFYLWVAAFSLFNLSVFWSFMSDSFDPEQSRRLFAIIASGASAGAIVGPAIPALFAGVLGLDRLMLIAALAVLMVVPLILALQHMKHTAPRAAHPSPQLQRQIDWRWWSGFRDVVSNPYLRAIGLFILLYVFIGSFVYFIQKNLLADFSRVERTQILSGVSWLVNSLTFVCAWLVTGRLVNRAGMTSTLACVPLALVVGMAAIALAPLIVVLLAVDVARRVGNYAVTRPAREMLFTQVSPDQRFKAKQVLDVVVYRGGDAASGSLFALLSEGLGLALVVMAALGSAVAGVWALVGIYLGRCYRVADQSAGPSAEYGDTQAAEAAGVTPKVTIARPSLTPQ